jgi:hypothetical protein
MKTYRDYLNERKVPLGPWVVKEDCTKVVDLPAKKPVDNPA